MTQRLQHITDFAEILHRQGIGDIVVSPGSRNAPLTRAFFNRFGKKCKSLVDERSAAYFALGQSLATGKPTVLISTSGTAVLNYAPAIAEAFHQQIPLLVITADRPAEWIGQKDNQTIGQRDIFRNYVKASYTFPVESSCPDDLWLSHRIANEAFLKTIAACPGPVHINVPLREPLYETLPCASENIWIIKKEVDETCLPPASGFLEDWEKAASIMLICGQMLPDTNFAENLKKLSADPRLAIIAEPIANINEAATVTNPDVVLKTNCGYPKEALPDLVIYFGGQVVSKKTKLFLRGLQKTNFWHISQEDNLVDTFRNINAHLCAGPASVLKNLKPQSHKSDNLFKKYWENESIKASENIEGYTKEIPYSDLLVFKHLSEMLPEGSVIFAGNSNSVRYLQYFSPRRRKYYANRGVSGIDGCLSTAAGLASKIQEQVYAIVGDLSFVYDSNALWNRELPKNLKIIIINNEGGGIFHLLNGPSGHEAFYPLENAHHPVDFKKLSGAFGISYQSCSSEKDIQCSIQKLIQNDKETQILEIKTPGNGKPQITKDFFEFLNIRHGEEMDNAERIQRNKI